MFLHELHTCFLKWFFSSCCFDSYRVLVLGGEDGLFTFPICVIATLASASGFVHLKQNKPSFFPCELAVTIFTVLNFAPNFHFFSSLS